MHKKAAQPSPLFSWKFKLLEIKISFKLSLSEACNLPGKIKEEKKENQHS